ncbi:ATP-grasp domain-containing protein [Algoriphagus limi]|uniref:ATP-grasp domain-containing protein n=1 Tax=Algoriphagus limi TaxID=2975273 RepID=A0ABT2G4S8_9BACT|nr:ATP-grasp domain-containing protein [Algoriphagus limi]MCS5488962.1 ATP-grasp domain-containing protein [Algoriphagus limi]
MDSKSVLIFSGNNQRAVIAFCRYAKTEQIPFDIIANGDDDIIFQTSYSQNVLGKRAKNELEIGSLLDYCKKVRQKRNVDIVFILPSTEFLNRFLLSNRRILLENHIEFGLCDEKTYSLISDKYKFSEFCRSTGIPVPKDSFEIPKKFPFVIKPKLYGQGLSKINEKPILVFSENDLKKIDRLENLSEYYFQEYIDGSSFYLLFYFSKNGGISIFSQENLIQQDAGASMILAQSSSIHNQEITQKFIQAFQKIRFSGLVMVEVKYDGQNFVMIEANPRLWGPSQLILDSNMSLFDDFSLDNGLKDTRVERAYMPGVFYFWSGGLISNLNEEKTPKFYQYSKDQFYMDYHKLIASDIYLKNDTLKIYLNEHN